MREKYLLFPIPQNGWTDVVSIRSTTVTTTRTAPKTTLTTVVHRFRDSILLVCIDCIQFPFAKGFCFRYECIFLAICVVFLVFLFRLLKRNWRLEISREHHNNEALRVHIYLVVPVPRSRQFRFESVPG